MAGVNEVKQTNEERAAEAQETRQLESALLQKLTSTFDPTAGLVDGVDRAIKEQDSPVEEPKEDIESPETDEASGSETQAEAETEESAESTEDDADEDLIPKSKFQKRVDELTREKRILEAKLAKQEREQEAKAPTTDSEQAKLDAMTAEELKAVKRQVRLAQIESSGDKARLTELMELEDKIDASISSAPQRFQKTQVSKFYDAVEQTKAELGEQFEKAGNDIFKYAKSIFDSAPELKSSATGQARAWDLAVDHYKALNKLSTGKSKVSELERQVNTLKKKVSLDTTSVKGNTKSNDDAKAFRAAKNGTLDQKAAFIKRTINTDNLIPEEYRS